MQHFDSDYMEGVVPEILNRLLVTNMEKTPGYGTDDYCASAKEKIRKAIGCPEAEIYFLVGGTQTNKTVITTMLRSYEGVIAVQSGHVGVHEAGAIEHGGHKVLAIAGENGKLRANDVKHYVETFYKDANWEHMVKPGMVYISHPTEYGTLYTKKELEELRKVCDLYNMPIFMDGARLGYGLMAKSTDVTLEDIASLTDVFYIGGTKCGALFGEAVVFPKMKLPHFFTMIKQHGALLAKGRLLGLQFDTLFTDDLYKKVCENGVRCAMMIRNALEEKGYKIYIDSPTNQQFVVVANKKMEELKKKVTFGYMEPYDDDHSIIRFCTSWATKESDVKELIELL